MKRGPGAQSYCACAALESAAQTKVELESAWQEIWEGGEREIGSGLAGGQGTGKALLLYGKVTGIALALGGEQANLSELGGGHTDWALS